MKRTAFLPTLALMGLAACGGSSTSSSGPLFSSFDSGSRFALNLAEEAEALGPSDANALKATGSADYTGAMVVGQRGVSVVVDAMVGEMDLTFDLADDTFSGTATNFYGRTGGARDGSVSIRDGQILRASDGVLISADLSGTLEFRTGNETITGEMIGTFAGDDAEVASGLLRGTYPVDPFTVGSLTIDKSNFDGAFVAERTALR